MLKAFAAWIGWPGAVCAAVALALVAAIHPRVSRLEAIEAEKIAYLNAEIGKLEPQVADVMPMRDEIQELLARKNIAESVQAHRLRAVQLLDQAARQRPEGVYFVAVRQNRPSVALEGYAASDAQVTRLIGNLERSPYLEKPRLVGGEISRPGRPGYPVGFRIEANFK
jgi:type IV pilus assembly protein PilN